MKAYMAAADDAGRRPSAPDTASDARRRDGAPAPGTSGLAAGATVEELYAELRRKEDETAMLRHLAKSNGQFPISAELSRQLSAALAQCVCEDAEAAELQHWLLDMDHQRQQLEAERLEQAETAWLLHEARESMSQLIVYKAAEVQEGSRDLDALSDALEEEIFLLERFLPAITNSVHKLQGDVVKAAADRQHLRATLLRSDDDEAAAAAAASALVQEQAVTKGLRDKVQELQEQYDAALRSSSYWQNEQDATARRAEASDSKAKKLEEDCRRLRAQLQQATLSQEELQHEQEEYRDDIANKMVSVQEHLERLRIERRSILEENKALKEQLASKDAEVEEAKRARERARESHERALAEIAAEHADETHALEREHQAEVGLLAERLSDCQQELVRFRRQLPHKSSDGWNSALKSVRLKLPVAMRAAGGGESSEEDDDAERAGETSEEEETLSSTAVRKPPLLGSAEPVKGVGKRLEAVVGKEGGADAGVGGGVRASGESACASGGDDDDDVWVKVDEPPAIEAVCAPLCVLRPVAGIASCIHVLYVCVHVPMHIRIRYMYMYMCVCIYSVPGRALGHAYMCYMYVYMYMFMCICI